MKRIFILDENILIQSQTCKDIYNSEEDDLSSLWLIITILEKCHRIGLSPELRAKYYEKIKNLEKNTKTPAIRIWNNFLLRKDKHVFCESCKKNLPKNIEHDKHVINPTLFLSGILVTTDEKLKKRLVVWAEKERLKIDVMSPRDALSYLEHPNEN